MTFYPPLDGVAIMEAVKHCKDLREVADQLGMKVGSVRKWLSAARIKSPWAEYRKRMRLECKTAVAERQRARMGCPGRWMGLLQQDVAEFRAEYGNTALSECLGVAQATIRWRLDVRPARQPKRKLAA